MNKKKSILAVLAVFFIIAIGVGGYFYSMYFADNTKMNSDKKYILVPTNSKYQDVVELLKPLIKDIEKFEDVAQKREYPDHVKSGRFLITKGMGNYAIIKSLRNNIPLSLAFNNQESVEKLVSRVSSQIELDSTSLINSLRDSVFMKKNGFNNETILGMFIPNTYDVKWNTTAESFRDKMANEYKNFWNPERLAKAKALGMTSKEVVALASIVHKETVKEDERPRVAGVYLNRLKIEMPLGADPTIIFALKKKDNNFNQVIKRVFENDLKIDSPYNTYIHTGLPPGPIAMPDISAIDAVLNAEKHEYLYFCASVTHFGYHDFAVTFAQHGEYAKKYREWVANQGIRR